ncbi:hypothetical protein C5745_07425 [Sphingobacterium haloxyli]|uniref:Uncharacterized protein n=1 Tax=Sphingobacterium haloxyli TaxID=2100533 RepID=A0A2S9J4N2_9SPHI|nr:hypothetical protein C5745_07425 [Sphingobacterium haloxyli]
MIKFLHEENIIHIGAFSKYQSNSLNEFIYEANKTGYNYFAATREKVLQNFAKTDQRYTRTLPP